MYKARKISTTQYTQFFTLAPTLRNTRGHNLRLYVSRSSLRLREKYFSQRAVNDWNRLPQSGIPSDSNSESVTSLAPGITSSYLLSWLYTEKILWAGHSAADQHDGMDYHVTGRLRVAGNRSLNRSLTGGSGDTVRLFVCRKSEVSVWCESWDFNQQYNYFLLRDISHSEEGSGKHTTSPQ